MVESLSFVGPMNRESIDLDLGPTDRYHARKIRSGVNLAKGSKATQRQRPTRRCRLPVSTGPNRGPYGGCPQKEDFSGYRQVNGPAVISAWRTPIQWIAQGRKMGAGCATEADSQPLSQHGSGPMRCWQAGIGGRAPNPARQSADHGGIK